MPLFKDGAAQLAEDIGHLYLSKSFSDVTIIIDGTELPAHRMVLSQRCPYFKAMFASGMIESTSKRIELHETPINAFKLALKWIYTAEVEFSQMETALEVLRLSDMYQLSGLARPTADYIQENCNIDNFCSILNTVASVLDYDQMIGDFIEDNCSDVLTHETFLNLSKDGFNVVLNDGLDFATNVEVLEAFVRWMKANTDQSTHFLDLLKQVPLNSIGFGELASIVPSELMSASVLMEVAREQQMKNENGQMQDINVALPKFGAKVSIGGKSVFFSDRFFRQADFKTKEVVIDLGQRFKLNIFCAERATKYFEPSHVDIFVSADEANWTCVADQSSVDGRICDYNFDERVVRFIRICGDKPLKRIFEMSTFTACYEQR